MNKEDIEQARICCADYQERVNAGESLTADELYDWTAQQKIIDGE
ncbi:hypothetical protein [Erwinia phyllosphaerae]|nr:hypothetical protein [Erwinia phyllosphaerae]